MIGQRQSESKKFVKKEMVVNGTLIFISIVRVKFIAHVLFVNLKFLNVDQLSEKKKEGMVDIGGVTLMLSVFLQ